MGNKQKRIESYSELYIKGDELGEGGNAHVYEAVDKSSGKTVALKILSDSCRNEEKKGRFIDEIQTMVKFEKYSGVMPIYGYDEAYFWYTMPTATSLIESIKKPSQDREGGYESNVNAVVDAFISICDTLNELHSNGYAHRDIKPANIYLLDGVPILGDFGLVELPDGDNNRTRDDRGLGAIFTIAPEMKRNPKDADGKKADVYSLAKTMWMFLSLDEKGFEGQYNCSDACHQLHKYNGLRRKYLVEIERLLKKATDNDPDSRPSITEFREALQSWKSSMLDEDVRIRNEWGFITDMLFNGVKPSRAEFNDPVQIVNALKVVAQSSAYNHMMFSEGGGLDFTDASLANEKDCIYLYNLSFISIVKPKILYYQSFGDSRWNYFLLVADKLNPILEQSCEWLEDLVEDSPAHYVPATYVTYGVYDYDKGDRLPDGYKHVERYLEGTFLIVAQSGPYNKIRNTYDGRHGYCSPAAFADYIEKLIRFTEIYKNKGCSEDAILASDEANRYPFTDRRPRLEEPMLSDLPDAKDFIKEHFESWSFKDIIDSTFNGKGNLNFYLTISIGLTWFSPFDSAKPFYYLSADGTVKQSVHDKMETPFYVRGRDECKNLIKRIMDKVKTLCEGYNPDSLSHSFNIEVRWNVVGKPSHLFTEEEIEREMREADDRISNMLVIDDDGFAHVIPTKENARLYPVVHEAWGAFNRYVGKYSSLSDLHPYYVDSLVFWSDYLRTGECQYCDENQNCDEKTIVKEIYDLMK